MDVNSSRQIAEDEAMAWVCATNKAGLDEWLAASASNHVAYLRAQMVWRETERLRSVSAGFPTGQVPPRGAIEQSPFFKARQDQVNAALKRVPSRTRRYALAAGMALAVGLGLAAYQAGFFDGGTTHSTAVGGLATVPISDGSVLTLNTATELNVSLTEHERLVDLKQGEAYFAVSADPARPFTVKAGSQRIVVVGTQFSVRRDGDHLKVIVTEGRLRMEERRWFGKARGPETLGAGKVAELDGGRIKVSVQGPGEMEQALRWREGYVVFDRTPLRAAVAEMNRYNARQLVVGDPALADIPVEGNFRTQNLDGFVRLMKYGFGVETSLSRDGKIVLKKKLPRD
jgi:transmembrane sensor